MINVKVKPNNADRPLFKGKGSKHKYYRAAKAAGNIPQR